MLCAVRFRVHCDGDSKRLIEINPRKMTLIQRSWARLTLADPVLFMMRHRQA